MAEVPKDIMEALTSYVLRYGGMCRDCADENGTCPHSGMPCDPDVCRPVVRRTIQALAYGIEHGFIASPFLSERERRTADVVTVPPLTRYRYLKPREFLLFASYCGDDNDACSPRRPCAKCLAMSNIYDENGKYLREFGAPSLSAGAGGEERG